MNKNNPDFIKQNKCPYCTYPCDSATSWENKKYKPKPGNISICLMCCEISEWDSDMNLIKFDINIIQNIVKRNRIKILQIKSDNFFSNYENKEFIKKREKYLKIRDELHETKNRMHLL